MKKLSILIPVYNEEKTVGMLLKNVIAVKLPVKKIEYIVIDDGSTDKTKKIVKKFLSQGITLLMHISNKGKGAAIKTGLQKATGDYILIQDADLEYDPNDIKRILKPVINGDAKIVYGTRLKRLPHLQGEERTPAFLLQYLGNKFLSLTTSILYNQWITDMECCYKLLPVAALKDMRINAKGFEFEPEITAKLMKRGYKIVEIPITTNPRSQQEGKKLQPMQDGFHALWTLIKYRFVE